MFGYIYQNDSQWFPSCMETIKDHFVYKNIIIPDIIEGMLKSFLKTFQHQNPREILNFFLLHRDNFLPYPKKAQNIYLKEKECNEISQKIKYEFEELIINPHLSFNANQNYNTEISQFIAQKLPYLFTCNEVNIYNCADPFVFVFNFNRNTFELYLYNEYPNFVLEQDFYSPNFNEKYHPTLIMRLNFEDIFMKNLDSFAVEEITIKLKL